MRERLWAAAVVVVGLSLASSTDAAVRWTFDGSIGDGSTYKTLPAARVCADLTFRQRGIRSTSR